MSDKFEDFKEMLLQAGAEEPCSANEYHDAARKIVNIERQAYYGDESPQKRLKQIRDLISKYVESEK